MTFDEVFLLILTLDALLIGWLLSRPAIGHAFKPRQRLGFSLLVAAMVTFVVVEHVLLVWGLFMAAMGTLGIRALQEEGATVAEVVAAIPPVEAGAIAVLIAWALGEGVALVRQSTHAWLGLPSLQQEVEMPTDLEY